MDDLIRSGAMPNQFQLHDFASVPFAGRPDALVERHLLSDAVVYPQAAYERQRFEAVARSVRDILAQRWIKTQSTYDRENPKRIYYLSMEFLIGRSLANNVMNLMLHPFIDRAARESSLDWFGLVEQEPDAGLGNGGLGRLAACFLDSMATMQLPAMGYGLRYEYGMFRQSIESGWQREHPDSWLRRPDPWEVSRRSEAVEVRLGCTFEIHQGHLRDRRQSPVDPDRHPLRPARRRLRRQDDQHACGCGAPRRPITSTSRSSARATSSAPWSAASAAQTLTRVLYPDDSTEHRARAALRPGIFPGRLLPGRPRAALPPRQAPTGAACPTRSPSSSTTPIPPWPSPS